MVLHIVICRCHGRFFCNGAKSFNQCWPPPSQPKYQPALILALGRIVETFFFFNFLNHRNFNIGPADLSTALKWKCLNITQSRKKIYKIGRKDTRISISCIANPLTCYIRSQVYKCSNLEASKALYKRSCVCVNIIFNSFSFNLNFFPKHLFAASVPPSALATYHLWCGSTLPVASAKILFSLLLSAFLL